MHTDLVAGELEALDGHGRLAVAGGGRVDVAGNIEAVLVDTGGDGGAADAGARPDDGQLLGDVRAGEGAGPDEDGVARDSRVDRGLDGGVAAVADQQEVVAGAVGDLLDAGEEIGACGPGD